MASSAALVLSNQLDFLAGILARVLESEGGDPFTSRIILLPNQEMKSWLLMQLAYFSSNKAIAGLKVFSWQEGMRYLLNQPGKELSYLELYLLVYEALRSSFESVVLDYIQTVGLTDLACELTDLFLIYGYYGINLWNGSDEDWQIRLWKQLFKESSWKMPFQLCSQPIGVRARIYCFGCNHLPAIIFDALLRLEELTIFHFSPCKIYWADLQSNRERHSVLKFKKSAEERELLECYLSDAHPLLANWGKLGRSTLQLFDRYDLDSQEIYDERKENLSQLAQLQRDLLFYTKTEKWQADGSIKIHKIGVSKLREIQVLRDEMLRAHEQGIAFSEMLVLAPDLNRYASLIEWVLSEGPYPIPYQMKGIESLEKQSASQGFQRLLALSRSRWSVDAVLLVLEHAAFRTKQGWGIEKLDRMRAWIQEARIRWGQNREHKERHLASWLGKKFPQTARGTWEDAMDRFIASLIYLFPDDFTDQPFISPVAGISLGDTEELEAFLELLSNLRQDLSFLVDESLKSPRQWAECLKNLYEKYFIPEESGILEAIFYALRKAEEKVTIPVNFSAISHFFSRKQTNSLGSSLAHAAQFASLEEGSILPCRALFLLGLDEESFPRRSFFSSLNLCKGLKGAPPLQSDVDRYLFLQAVSSVRDLLVISYGHISAEDGKEMNPSIVVQELFNYVHGSLALFTHPSFPWHKSCFEDPALRPMSLQADKTARIFHGEKEPLQCFSSLLRPESFVFDCPNFLLLKNLKNVFSHPWKHYLQKKFHLWLKEPEKEDWSEFEIDARQKSLLIRQGLVHPLEGLVSSCKKKGTFPTGLFGEIVYQQIVHTSEEWKEHLSEWNIDPKQLGTLFLQENLQGPFARPPLEISLENSSLKIIGEVPNCSLRGPLHMGDDSFTSLLRNWPAYLVALCSLQVHEIFCIRSGKVRVVEAPEKALKECVELYFLGTATPLPIVSQWADSLVRKKDPEELEKAFISDRMSWEDEVYDWVIGRVKKPSAEEMVDSWSSYLQARLQPLLQFYPVRSK